MIFLIALNNNFSKLIIDQLFKYRLSLYITLYVYEQYENEIYDFLLLYIIDFQYNIINLFPF